MRADVSVPLAPTNAEPFARHPRAGAVACPPPTLDALDVNAPSDIAAFQHPRRPLRIPLCGLAMVRPCFVASITPSRSTPPSLLADSRAPRARFSSVSFCRLRHNLLDIFLVGNDPRIILAELLHNALKASLAPPTTTDLYRERLSIARLITRFLVSSSAAEPNYTSRDSHRHTSHLRVTVAQLPWHASHHLESWASTSSQAVSSQYFESCNPR